MFQFHSNITGANELTLNDWVIFFEMWFHFLMLFTLCAIFYMKLVQYNECLVSIVDTDGLVLHGIRSHSADYALMRFPVFKG